MLYAVNAFGETLAACTSPPINAIPRSKAIALHLGGTFMLMWFSFV